MISVLSRDVYDCLSYKSLKESYSNCYDILASIEKPRKKWSFEKQDVLEEILDKHISNVNERDLLKFYSRGNKTFEINKLIKFIKSADPRLDIIQYSFAISDFNNDKTPKYVPVILSKGKYFIVKDLIANSDEKCKSAIKPFALAIANKVIYESSNNKNLFEILNDKSVKYDKENIFVSKEGVSIEEYSDIY